MFPGVEANLQVLKKFEYYCVEEREKERTREPKRDEDL